MSRFFEATVRQRDVPEAPLRLPLPDVAADGKPSPALHAAPLTDHGVRGAVPDSFRPPAGFRTVSLNRANDARSVSKETAEHASESYRIIRTKIVQHPRQPRIICVSSSTPGDGKSVTALNIAGALAFKRQTTAILVDVDLRRLGISELLNPPPGPGVGDVLAGACRVQDAAMRLSELPSLYYLPAGSCNANPTELLDSERWPSLVSWLRDTFTYVILDSPPVGMVADYDLIQSVAEGTILVLRPGHTKRKLLQKTFDQIPADKLLGVVVNAVDDWFLWKTHNRYYDKYYRCQNQE